MKSQTRVQKRHRKNMLFLQGGANREKGILGKERKGGDNQRFRGGKKPTPTRTRGRAPPFLLPRTGTSTAGENKKEKRGVGGGAISKKKKN